MRARTGALWRPQLYTSPAARRDPVVEPTANPAQSGRAGVEQLRTADAAQQVGVERFGAV